VAAEERRKAAEIQGTSIREDARKRAQEAAKGIARQGEQAAAVEGRRLALKVREVVSQRVIVEASKELAGLIGKPAYREVLRGWIVEAALGLNAPQAEVLASGPEMAEIDDALLREAEAEVKELSGVAVSLLRSKAQPLVGQGVVVTSTDGRTAFNNQVATRMERYQSEVRKLIYEALKES
jgi:vacuolar-type H+-ATPase subunit E/Vma4